MSNQLKLVTSKRHDISRLLCWMNEIYVCKQHNPLYSGEELVHSNLPNIIHVATKVHVVLRRHVVLTWMHYNRELV